MERFVGKIRPQIFLALVVLGVTGILSLRLGQVEIAVGCVTAIAALAKDVLQGDND